MPTIRMSRAHKRPMAEARASVEKIAKAMDKKFGVQHDWDGNTLHFERPGVNGHIELAKGKVTVHVELGFLLFALKGPVEEEIGKRLEQEFG